jgi:hypothetical protein
VVLCLIAPNPLALIRDATLMTTPPSLPPSNPPPPPPLQQQRQKRPQERVRPGKTRGARRPPARPQDQRQQRLRLHRGHGGQNAVPRDFCGDHRLRPRHDRVDARLGPGAVHPGQRLPCRRRRRVRRHRLGHGRLSRPRRRQSHGAGARSRRAHLAPVPAPCQVGVRKSLLPLLADEQEAVRGTAVDQHREMGQDGLERHRDGQARQLRPREERGRHRAGHDPDPARRARGRGLRQGGDLGLADGPGGHVVAGGDQGVCD